MWSVDGANEACPSDMVVHRALFEFDLPEIFTTEGRDGRLYLAYFVEKEQSLLRYLVTETTESVIQSLQTGGCDVATALRGTRSWIVDLKANWEVADCWRVDALRQPVKIIPNRGVMLYRHLKPYRNWFANDVSSSVTYTINKHLVSKPRFSLTVANA